MKLIETKAAVGHVLAHDLTQIIPNEYKGARFRKGQVVSEEDIPVLLSMGKEHLYIYEKTPGVLHEDEAAPLLAELAGGGKFRLTAPHEGKIELFAEADGLFKVDSARLAALNSVGEMMIATRQGNTPVHAGDKLAGTRIVPLLIEEAKLRAAIAAAGSQPLLSLLPYRLSQAGIINTGSELYHGRIVDKFTPVLKQKLADYNVAVQSHQIVDDAPQMITDAILQQVEQGCELVLVTGGMSVDPDDRTPLAIKNSGARIVSYGAPVLPGAMFLLAYLGEVPVLGLPGCVMYAGHTIFDVLLPRILACDPISLADLAQLGEGGLCLNCEVCTFPNCGFGK